VWKTIESSTEKTRMGKTKEGRNKGRIERRKRSDRVTEERKKKKKKDKENDKCKEASKGMGDLE